MRSVLSLAILGLSSLAVAHDPHDRRAGYGYGGDQDTSSGVAPTSTSLSVSSTNTPASSAGTSGLTGGSVCTDYMCISGVVNGSTTTYVMQSKGKADLGWMAMGFGSMMSGSPMVIMWPNADGSITLSQRSAPGEVMPTVDANPPRTATADAGASDLAGTLPKLSFTIPSDSSASQTIIWAFGSAKPNDAAVDAPLMQHDDSGPVPLDLSQPADEARLTALASPAEDPKASTSIADDPLLPYQKMVVAHALLCTIGFLILLPAGALLARYARTFTNAWFIGHWAFQFAFAGPIIVAGVGLGFGAVASAKADGLSDDHMKWGVAIFVLYLAQLMLGALIHWVKPTSWTVGKRRPAQNYFHAVFGILIIALAFYQVRNGFRTEWHKQTGRPPISNAANIVWYVWVVLIPVLYLAGLALLPRQFRLERPHHKAPSDEFATRER